MTTRFSITAHLKRALCVCLVTPLLLQVALAQEGSETDQKKVNQEAQQGSKKEPAQEGPAKKPEESGPKKDSPPPMTPPAKTGEQDGKEQVKADDTKSAAASETKPKSQKKAADSPRPGKLQDLLTEPLTKRWKLVSAEEDTKLADVWRLVKGTDKEPPVLVCLGTPKGYLRTIKVYRNYEFSFECRYPKDPNGNSGILIHTSTKKDKIWPDGVQVQLHRPNTGSIFASGEGKAFKVDAKPQLSDDLTKWVSCKIVSKDGQLAVMVNGKEVAISAKCEPSSGHIALQSEGSEIHFRKVTIRELPPTVTKPKPTPAKTVEAPEKETKVDTAKAGA